MQMSRNNAARAYIYVANFTENFIGAQQPLRRIYITAARDSCRILLDRNGRLNIPFFYLR